MDTAEVYIPQHARLLRFFEFEHLPEQLQKVSRPFGLLARSLVEEAAYKPDSYDPAEITVALRKLLESKDAAVRSALGR